MQAYCAAGIGGSDFRSSRRMDIQADPTGLLLS